jgi:hypothetical protein
MNAIPSTIVDVDTDELIRIAAEAAFAPREDEGPRYAIVAPRAKVTSQGVHYGEIEVC